jgi:Rrf2 family protein
MHSCVNLGWLPGEAVTAKRLAAFYDLPTAYLNKQLQALTRAGILSSASGPKGGFQLARDPRNITLLDIVVAIDGTDDAFRCPQIRSRARRGRPRRLREACLVSRAMRGGLTAASWPNDDRRHRHASCGAGARRAPAPGCQSSPHPPRSVPTPELIQDVKCPEPSGRPDPFHEAEVLSASGVTLLADVPTPTDTSPATARSARQESAPHLHHEAAELFFVLDGSSSPHRRQHHHAGAR